jgi:hypothetical protein
MRGVREMRDETEMRDIGEVRDMCATNATKREKTNGG